MAKTTVIRKPIISETLKAMEVGASMFISTKDVKLSTAYSAVRRLRSKGYSFRLTEKGMINQFRVERIS